MKRTTQVGSLCLGRKCFQRCLQGFWSGVCEHWRFRLGAFCLRGLMTTKSIRMGRFLLKLESAKMAECNVQISFKDKKVHIPDELVAQDLQGAYLLVSYILVALCAYSPTPNFPHNTDLNGVQFLKLRPTAPAIVKLVCGKCEKNSSLSNGDCLKALKEKRNAAVEASVLHEGGQGAKKKG